MCISSTQLATRCQPLRDGDRKAVHCQANSNQYDRENIHRRMYELRFTNEYENYEKYENNLKDVSSFGFVACSSFALGDIAEFVLAELAADGRNTVGKDMRLKMVVFVKHNPRGKVR